MRWYELGLVLSVCLVTLFSLASYGAVERPVLYVVFLCLSAIALLSCWLLPFPIDAASTAVGGIGIFLLMRVAMAHSLLVGGYIVLAMGWLAFFAVWVMSRHSLRLTRSMVVGLVCLGMLEACLGVTQAIVGADVLADRVGDLSSVASGTLVNRNHFAGLLNMALMLGIGSMLATFFESGSRRLRPEVIGQVWLWLGVSVVVSLAVVLSFSRGGVAALFATIVFLLAAFMWKKWSGSEGSVSKGLGLVFVFVLLLVGLASWVGIDYLYSRIGEVEADAGIRLPVYRDSVNLILDNPLTGVGPGMYKWRFRPYQQSNLHKLYDHAHNDYLETAAEWGLPAAVLFWLFVCWRCFDSLRLFLVSRNPLRRGLALGCAAAIFSILVHSMIDFNLQIPSNWVVFCILLALSWGMALERKGLMKVADAAKRSARGKAS